MVLKRAISSSGSRLTSANVPNQAGCVSVQSPRSARPYAVRGDEGVDSEATLNYVAAKFWV
jgi:hypothetical protein